ncbi:GNAT family N-acetyltransferase/peptidase C39 family protein [Alteromonas sp. ASW11-19]|uniref:GNAT family N-acetyltransferase/peptidase C39 family protein n=1 Tax=Alteromonas salexigens TaxID=2982530 RepID=A0ABT2VQU2_9ALTE|nr:GNAT family N-acetyltransferase/peptidase C39 family protein [Alteromonas salexigens]MCU7555248.1 GNAT family N-acetyltransferase/peptidase C39 family protein [Alteromonas salexigens]
MNVAIPAVTLRDATHQDLVALLAIEHRCFDSDRLSRRRMRFYIDAPHAELVVAEQAGTLVAYGLLLMRRGTQLTRLYSLAVLPEARGLGVAENIIKKLEDSALARGKRFMRLEVSEQNHGARRLYSRLGFQQFGVYSHYYDDNTDAIRMQKVLSQSVTTRLSTTYPWYEQTTEFTCGPASLMMALHHLDPQYTMSQQQELAIWRRATTIFMTSGHGGCHPIGLALAASDAGFTAQVWLNRPLPLFADGVRSAHKKAIIQTVETQFAQEAEALGLEVLYHDWTLEGLKKVLAEGATVVCLVSTYAFDKRKAPHWVTLTGADAHCFYLHDPDADGQPPMEFQHIPVAQEDFLRQASYGSRKVRTLLVLQRSPTRAS